MSGGRRGPTITKQKWTEEEEAALRAGVEKYDVGKWRHIQKDEVFGPVLKNRSNVDLKDKWRNLNMDAGASRRDSRGGHGDRSANRRKRRKRADDDSEAGGVDDDEDYVEGGRRPRSKRQRRLPRRKYDDDPDVKYPEPAAAPTETVDVSEEHILAAMIQLQDPNGSDSDGICQLLEDSYGMSATVKRSVKATLKQMMEAGRITCSNGLYRLSGIPQQLVEQSSRFTGEEDGSIHPSWVSNGSRTAREAAEAAARAVQEAEEAAELAAELIAAADRFDREAPSAKPVATPLPVPEDL